MPSQFDNPARLVRELKGAPLSILLLLLIYRQPLSNAALCSWSGYTDKTVAAGLYYLESQQIVVRSTSGWRLADGFQLPLQFDESEIFRPLSSSDLNYLT